MTALPFDPATQFAPELRDGLLELRRDLHRHPELSFQEHRTAERLERELRRLEPREIRRVADTGLVARMAGRNADAPLVAIRGDIDALPIQENTGVAWASEVDGAMHACGHDVHAAWAIGAASLLADQPAEGDVLIILQPGEETGQGAARVLDSGALDQAEAIFGGHVDLRFTVGQVVAQSGPLAAATDTLEIELEGPGGHGARPHETSDPIVAAAALISALQTITARRLDPATPGVVSIGAIHAGTAPNIIPGRVSLSGTIRTVDADSRTLIHDEIRHIAGSIAHAHRVEARVSIELGPPALLNAAQPVAWARQAVASILGEEALVPLPSLNLAGEDFACYLDRMPGCFVRIGARNPSDPAVAAHTPGFLPSDESVLIGAAVLAGAARHASAALAEP